MVCWSKYTPFVGLMDAVAQKGPARHGVERGAGCCALD